MSGSKLTASLLALAASIALCNQGQSIAQSAQSVGQQDSSQAPTASDTHGINVSYIDTSVSPGKDFYRYACGKWLSANPIPPEYSKWGTWQILDKKNLEILRDIMETDAKDAQAKPGSNTQKIGDFYESGMDATKIQQDGIKPLAAYFHQIDAIKSISMLPQVVAQLHMLGAEPLFGMGSAQDYKNSNWVIGDARQGGLGLPDRDYYVVNEAHFKDIRAQYVKHVAKMFELSGVTPAIAQANAQKIMAMETRLAQAALPNTETRKAYVVYHKMTVSQLQSLTPNFSWTKYLSACGHATIADINVEEPSFFKSLNKDLQTTSLNDWKIYLRWHLLDSAAPYLPDKFVDEDFHFNGQVMSGKKENLPRWKRVVRTVSSGLGEAVGVQYVARQFPPEAKARAVQMVENLRAVLRDDLASLPWMEPQTRTLALAKFDKLTVKIGYPDKWRDYTKLAINRNSYVGNVFAANQFEFNRQLLKVGKPVDRAEWQMYPQTINAYNDPVMMEIVFPAAILQPPFFDKDADDATNYGGIGMVIGHEMTHDFDDQGALFDANGNLNNWWTKQDSKDFNERTDCVAHQFDQYTVSGGLHEKGKLVVGEATADLGGLILAHRALEKALGESPETKDQTGFTPTQRFFIAFAQIWATNIRPEQERLSVTVDPHPTPEYRVNGTVINSPDFAKAFDVKPGDPMYHDDKARCVIW